MNQNTFVKCFSTILKCSLIKLVYTVNMHNKQAILIHMLLQAWACFKVRSGQT